MSSINCFFECYLQGGEHLLFETLFFYVPQCNVEPYAKEIAIVIHPYKRFQI